ncbi:hypothetical protein B0H14DRAFT_2606259 [Mycena olivaceomarginata]|nr:hypothetical protein B0H14DRAFT_2606259 [Mycena olivaceomarginata]
MVSHDVVVMNWPEGVRAPILMRAGRSASALTKAERQLLMAAIDAREGDVDRGLHFIKRVYTNGAMVMVGHDYSLVPPAGSADSAAVKKFWRSSLEIPVHCTDGSGTVWKTQYDIDLPNDSLLRAAVVPNPFEEDAVKVKDGDDEEDEEDEDEEEEEPPKKKGKGKSKGKKKQTESKGGKGKGEGGRGDARGSVPTVAQKRKGDHEESAPQKRLKADSAPSAPPPPGPSCPKRKVRALETVEEAVEPIQVGGGGSKPKEATIEWLQRPPRPGFRFDLPLDSDSELSSVPEASPPPPAKRRRVADASAKPATAVSRQTMSHVAVPELPPAVVTRRATRSSTAASAAAPSSATRAVASSSSTTASSSAATSSSAVEPRGERGGTLYAPKTGRPIGDWYPKASSGEAVGTFRNAAPEPKRVPPRASATASTAETRPKPKALHGSPIPPHPMSPPTGNMSFGAPGPLLTTPVVASHTTQAVQPNAAVSNVTPNAAPVVGPVAPIPDPAPVALVIAPGALATPAAPPAPAAAPIDLAGINAVAMVGLFNQLNQLFGSRDPNVVIAALQGGQGPPPQ